MQDVLMWNIVSAVEAAASRDANEATVFSQRRRWKADCYRRSIQNKLQRFNFALL